MLQTLLHLALLLSALSAYADLPRTAVLLPGPLFVTSTLLADERPHALIVQNNHVIPVKDARQKDQAEPRIWIGVRVSPLPRPLAAHVGENGVMIVNVVKDSPADQAGIEQYDVVLRFAQRVIHQPQDLTAAVADSTADEQATIEILRKGQPRQLQITPANRPKGAAGAWKYEEPEEAGEDTVLRWRGKWLLRDPNGHWLFRDLGPLHGLPDVLRKLEDFDVHVDVQPGLRWHCPDVDVRVFRQGDEEGGADDQRDIKILLRIDEDGKQLSISSDKTGKIEVTHRDASGKETTATYDNADALRDADPEAFHIYTQHIGGRGRMMFRFQPFKDDLKRWQKDFQEEINRAVQDALKAWRDVQRSHMDGKPGEADDEGAGQPKGEKKRIELRTEHKRGGQAGDGGQLVLMVRTDESGAVTVIEDRGDGQRQTRKYPSKAALKSADPDLYSRVKSLLEPAPE